MEQLVAYWSSANYEGDDLTINDMQRVVDWIQDMGMTQALLVSEMNKEPHNGSVASFSKTILGKEATYRKACDMLVKESSEEVHEHFGEENLRIIAEWTMKIRKQSFHGPEKHFRAVLSGLAATKLREHGHPGGGRSIKEALEELGNRIVHEEWKIANENLAAFATILTTKFQSSKLVTDHKLRRDTHTLIGVTMSQAPVIEHYTKRSHAILIVCALRRSDWDRPTILDHFLEKGERSLGAYMAQVPIMNGEASATYFYHFRELQEALNTIRAKPTDRRWTKDELSQLCKAGAYLSLYLAVEDLNISEELLAEEMREN